MDSLPPHIAEKARRTETEYLQPSRRNDDGGCYRCGARTILFGRMVEGVAVALCATCASKTDRGSASRSGGWAHDRPDLGGA